MSNPIPKEIRDAVHERERDMCIRCGTAGSDIHHRKRRRDGGHSRPNCILLCRVCHQEAHANPAWARERGLIVSAFTDDIAGQPVHTYAGWVRLESDGTTTMC